MKWRYQKTIRILYHVFITLVLVVMLSISVRFVLYTEQTTFFIASLAASFILLIFTLEAMQEGINQIRRRGHQKRIGAFGSESVLVSTLKSLAKGHKEKVDRVVPQDFVYVLRDDGSTGQVYLMDVYRCLIADQKKPSVLRQQDWVATKILDRSYFDDVRLVCLQAGVVRVKGNGALIPLHAPGYALELIKRHFFN